jgi:hypothetical protein
MIIKRKGKAHPLQAMQAQRGLGELRLLDFLASALYGGRLLASRTGRLYPQRYPWYSFSRGVESTPGPRFSRKEMSLKNPVTRALTTTLPRAPCMIMLILNT